MNNVSLIFFCALILHNIVNIVISYESKCEAHLACRLITDCRNHVEQIKRLHLTNGIHHRDFLLGPTLRLTCGFEGKIPKICCPLQDDSTVIAGNTRKTSFEKRSVHGDCGNFLWNKNLPPDGGHTDLFEFPWLALLQYQNTSGRKFGCGGVLISDRYVLTAAHCLHPFKSLQLSSVRLGEYDLTTDRDCLPDDSKALLNQFCNDKAIELGIEAQIVHEGYKNSRGPSDFDQQSHDIALLRLDRSVKFSDFVRPICLPGQETVDQGKYLAAGWGVMPGMERPLSDVKRMFRLNLIKRSACDAIYGRSLQQDVMCAAAKANNVSCIGDSGGPLMSVDKHSRMTVIGVHAPAGGGYCLTADTPNTYTDVRQYSDWILSKM